MTATTQEAPYPTTEREWYDDGITITIPKWHANRLLQLAGLERDASGRYGGKYWEVDEALRHAALEIAETRWLSAISIAESHRVD